MGFNIQIMPLPEVYLAIQQGAVSGQENPVDTIFSNKFYEVAPVPKRRFLIRSSRALLVQRPALHLRPRQNKFHL